MEYIIEKLKKFSYTELECKVYIDLAKTPNLNGSQIAKHIGVPRTSVYKTLNDLLEKKAVFSIDGKTTTYIAKDPKLLLDETLKQLEEDSKYLKTEFNKIHTPAEDKKYINVEGYKNCIKFIRELIKNAKEEIYINTNIDLNVFQEEIKIARKAGVRIVFFSFFRQELEKTSVEQYYKFMKKSEKVEGLCKIYISIDNKTGLIAGGKKEENFTGTFSENKIFIDMIEEHIHNDIYISKIENKLKIDWFEKCKLETKRELNCKNKIEGK